MRAIGLGFGLALACLLALANRSAVVFSLDPISPASDDLSVQMPLYGVIFIALFIGILLGGFTVWLGQRKSHGQAIMRHETSIIEDGQ